MADCQFDIQMKDTVEAFVAKAQELSKKMNGTFTGDIYSGNFNIPTPFGTLAGSYSVERVTVHITVTDKPMLMSCGVVSDMLRGYLT